MTPQPILLDVDTGVDDALAIMLALRSPEVHVAGITTVSGNVPVDACTRNTLLVLDRLGAPEIPVATGAPAPLAGAPRRASHVHGTDGLGDLPDRPAASRTGVTVDAVELLYRAIDRFPGDLVVVATGPLTNIARAAQKDPDRMRGVRALTVMAGAVAVPGNVTPVAEFNVWSDPEAAAVVLSAGLPLTLVPLDVTERVALSRATVEEAAGRGPIPAFVRDITRLAMEFHRREVGIDALYLHDPLAVGVVIDGSIVTGETLRLDVECRGELTAGMVVADRRRRPRDGRPVQVCTGVDVGRFTRLFRQRVLDEPLEG